MTYEFLDNVFYVLIIAIVLLSLVNILLWLAWKMRSLLKAVL